MDQGGLSRGFRFRRETGWGSGGGAATRDGDRVAEKRSPLPRCATGIRLRPRVTVATWHDVRVCVGACVVSQRATSSVERPRFARLAENAPAREHFPVERPSHEDKKGGEGGFFFSLSRLIHGVFVQTTAISEITRIAGDRSDTRFVSHEYLIQTESSLEFCFFFLRSRFQTLVKNVSLASKMNSDCEKRCR